MAPESRGALRTFEHFRDYFSTLESPVDEILYKARIVGRQISLEIELRFHQWLAETARHLQ